MSIKASLATATAAAVIMVTSGHADSQETPIPPNYPLTSSQNVDGNVITLAQAEMDICNPSTGDIAVRRKVIAALSDAAVRQRMQINSEREKKGLPTIDFYPEVSADIGGGKVMRIAEKSHPESGLRLTLTAFKRFSEQKKLGARNLLILVHEEASNKQLPEAQAALNFAIKHNIENPTLPFDDVYVVFPEKDQLNAQGRYVTKNGPTPHGTIAMVVCGIVYENDLFNGIPSFVLKPIEMGTNNRPILNSKDGEIVQRRFLNLGRGPATSNLKQQKELGHSGSDGRGGDSSGEAAGSAQILPPVVLQFG